MSKVKTDFQFSNIKELNDLTSALNKWSDEVNQQLNGKLDFFDNVRVVFSTFTFASMNLEYKIQHSLGRTPIGFIATKMDGAAIIYNGTSQWTSDAIYLKSNAGSVTVTLMVF